MDLDIVKSNKPIFSSLQTNYLYVNRVVMEKPSSMMRCHYHTTYEIYYINKGERLYFIRDKLYHIKAGDMVFISPGEIHATLNEKDFGYDRIVVNFDNQLIQDVAAIFEDINFFEVFEQNKAVISFDAQERIAIEKLLFDMLSEYEEKALTGKLKLMLLELLRQANLRKIEFDKDGIRPSYAHKTIADIVGYVNNNYALELKLEDVAKKFFISPCYLSRAFKKTVNISLVDYINNVRVMEAKKMLTSTNMSIIQIGEAVGFKSNTHFGRVFKKITGFSPLKYKKLNNT